MVEFVGLILTTNYSHLPVVGVAACVLRYQQVTSFYSSSFAASRVFKNKRTNTEKHHLVLRELHRIVELTVLLLQPVEFLGDDPRVGHSLRIVPVVGLDCRVSGSLRKDVVERCERDGEECFSFSEVHISSVRLASALQLCRAVGWVAVYDAFDLCSDAVALLVRANHHLH